MCVLWMVTRTQPSVESSFVWFHPVMLFEMFTLLFYYGVCVCVCAYLRKLASIWDSSWMSSASLWAILMANSLSLFSCSKTVCVSVSSSRSNASCISSSAWNKHTFPQINNTHTQSQHLWRLPHLCLLSVPTGWQQTETQAYKWVPAGVLTVMTTYLSSEHWALVGQK